MTEEIETREFNSHKLATVFHDAKSKSVVIFCHGYRGSSLGPSRFFVVLARKLKEKGISSLRFDQFGGGNSEGDFFDSSFKDWVKTTKEIAQYYVSDGYKVALLGQSMGGAAVIDVASQISDISCLVAWAPDPNVEEFKWPESGVIEEGGQIVKASYWQEAHDAKVVAKLRLIKCPTYIVQCDKDEYVSEENRQAIIFNLQQNQTEQTFHGYRHSSWTYAQADAVINSTLEFLAHNLYSNK